jgi:adenylate cyclase
MFTDIVGYTAMSQENEPEALDKLREHRELIRPIFASHGGREVKTIGDAFLVEFASALAATRCAADIEDALRRYNIGKPKALQVRIGIHVGDVVREDEDVYGDTVNVASRIVQLAENGGTCISQQVYDQVRNKVPFRFAKLETPNLKNVSVPIDVYRLESAERRADAKQVQHVEARSLAVLPFANMSPDPADEYFADGMTEEVISTISRVDQIGVISRTSVMQYKKAPKSVREVSKELGVGTVLEGSVRKADNKVRVTVQLIDALRDRHLWSESYDRDLEDVFDIQSDIARQVVEALKVRILPHVSERLDTKPTTSTEAYTLYLKGRYSWNKRGLEDVKRAAHYFREAVEADPAFALGYVGIGDCCRTLITNWGVDPEENDGKAKAMVAKALELDPDLAEAHATRGLSSFSDCDLKAAEEEFKTAIELKPSYATAHQWYSQLLMAETRWNEALSHVERAVELDPFSQITNLIHTFFYEAKRDYRTGLALAKRASELSPNDASLRMELAWFYGKLKMVREARREATEGAKFAKGAMPRAETGARAILAYLEDDEREVRAVLPELKAHLGRTFTAVRFIADLHFYLGEKDEGFEWLERSYKRKEFDLFYIKSNEFLDGVRSDPRYLSLVSRLGLG